MYAGMWLGAALAVLAVVPGWAREGRVELAQAKPPVIDTSADGFNVCNRSQWDVQVAKALVTEAKNAEGETLIESEGWFDVPRGTCVALWEGRRTHRYYLVYAEAAEVKREWSGKVRVCVRKEAFTLREPSCGTGVNHRMFDEVDAGDPRAPFTYVLD